MITVGSLFAGIGGFDLGLARAGMDIKWQVEIDDFCNKVLAKHWPEVKRYRDVKEVGKHNLEPVDLICGGFPCQPFSHAGKRRGKEDHRYLWPEMFRIIKEVKPRWIIGENVIGFFTMGIEQSIANLEAIGYEVAPPFIIPACAIDSDQRRYRVWIIAHAKGLRWNEMVNDKQKQCPPINNESFKSFRRCCLDLHLAMEPNFNSPGSGIRRNDDGVSSGVDRLKCLGNAIVPQVVVPIMQAIKEIDV